MSEQGRIFKTKKNIIGYKVCRSAEDLPSSTKLLVKLLIPRGALVRESIELNDRDTRKMRANKAIVLSVRRLRSDRRRYGLQSGREVKPGTPTYTVVPWVVAKSVQYTVGETVKPHEPFDMRKNEQCASGIHFFLTRSDAVLF